MEHEMNEIIEGILDGFDQSNKDTYDKLIFKTVSDLRETGYDMKDPDVFNTILAFKQDNLMELIVEELHEPCKNKENQHKANFVFTHYSFLENHIRKLIESRSGSCFVADISHSIIKKYLEWLISGKMDEIHIEIESFWVPKFGMYTDWFIYCDALYELYYGLTEHYLVAYENLLKCEIRKYKHLQHDWFMKLVDAEPFQFNTTYDDYVKNPLNGYCTLNNTYLIRKKVIPKDLIGRFSEPASNERHMTLLKTIPIAEVEEVYYKTKEIYM